MNQITSAIAALLRRAFIITFFLSLAASQVRSQYQSSVTDGVTPQAIKPGAPVGSFALSDIDTVNVYNGHVSVNIPILTTGGRGGVGTTIKAHITRAGWRVQNLLYSIPDNGQFIFFWAPYPEPDWWQEENARPGVFAFGSLVGKRAGKTPFTCYASGGGGVDLFSENFTYLVFTAPDGTEYSLFDTEGDNLFLNTCNPSANFPNSRGRVFASRDGNGASFVSDDDIYDYPYPDMYDQGQDRIYPNGYLILRDGTRYRIELGAIKWMRDRNGNKLTFENNKITDSIKRETTLSFNPSSFDQVTYLGYDGTSRQVKVWYSPLSAALRTGFSIKKYIELFPELPAASSLNYDPTVISAIDLPDNRRYEFRYNSYGEIARIVLPTGGAIEYDYAAGIRDAYVSGQIGEDAQDSTYGSVPPPPPTFSPVIYRRVIERRVYPDGVTLQGKTMYSRPEQKVTSTWQINNQGYVDEDNLAPDGTLLSRTRHHYQGYLGSASGPASKMFYSQGVLEGYPDEGEGKEYKTEQFGAGGTSPLVMIENDWTGPVITETKTTLLDTNQVSKQTFAYDDYYNRKDIWEYDYGAGAPPTHPIRHRHIDYVTTYNGSNYAGDNNIHLRSLPLREIIYSVNPANGTETWMAQTEYEYDKYDTSTHHAALVNRTNITGHDTAFTTSYTTRGNVTQINRWLNSSGSSLVSSWTQYDIAGNVVKAIDAKGYAAIFDFSDRFGSPDDDARQNTPPTNPNWLNGQTTFAFATKVTNALGHETYAQFDYFLGKPVNSEDANGIVNSVAYNDALDRPTQGIQARYKVGSGVTSARRQMTFAYDDTNRWITTTSDRDAFNDNILTGKAYYDGLGRTWRSATYEGNTGAGNTWAITDTQFDALGRVSQASNPYRAADPNTASPPSGMWTTTTYDALSRVKTVQTPDTAVVTTDYSGNAVTATDQAGRQRRSLTDALGRLIRVDEPNGCNNCLGSVSSPTQPTDYAYDALGNLRKVTQGTQTRWFAYDSLSRLIRAKNPEQDVNTSLNLTDPITGNSQWSMKYTYDGNGNLMTKTDARDRTTTITYDALNRPTTKTYSCNTPAVSYVYDNQSLPMGAPSGFIRGFAVGRLVAVNYGSNSGAGSYYGYDELGRVVRKTQQINGNNYVVQNVVYNRASAMTSESYPSGHTVNYAYDTAGRLSSFTGNLGDDVSRNYATGITYTSAGLMTQEKFQAGTANQLYHNLHYNNRLQLYDARLGTGTGDGQAAEWTWNRGALLMYYDSNYAYGDGGLNNNGNVYRMDHFIPLNDSVSQWAITEDYYGYDSLNRVTSFTDLSGGATSASQNFSYDRFGNRCAFNAAGGVSGYCPGYNTSNNRISNLTYDAAGNITYDPATGGTMIYDGESRLVMATNGGGGSYTYDGEGKRVKRMLAGGQEWWYVYGIGGELLAEYLSTAPTTVKKEYGYRAGQLLVVWDADKSGDERLKWLVQDHLGSTRMEIDKSGSLAGVTRHDYTPFGEELFAGIRKDAQGQPQYGYTASNVRQKFDGYERDNETGLDYAQARYYANIQGRFTSPDEFNGGPEEVFGPGRSSDEKQALPYADIFNPQSLNKYQYCLNNPLRYIDPEGHQTSELENIRKGLKALELSKKALERLGKSGSLVSTATEIALEGVFGPKIYFSRGGLDKAESAFAAEVAVYSGRSFMGVAKRDEPGIDGVSFGLLTTNGIFKDIQLISLKETQGGLTAILDHASKAEGQAKKAGYKNVDLYIKSTNQNVDVKTLVDFIQKGASQGKGGIAAISNQGTIQSVTIFARDGAVKVAGGKAVSCDSDGKCQ